GELADELDVAIVTLVERDRLGGEYSPDVADAVEEFVRVRTGGAYGMAAPSAADKGLSKRDNEAWKLQSDTKWNSTKSSTFDLVEPMGERQQDLVDFPQNAAGLAGIYLGWDKFNLQVAGGAFGGIGKSGCILPEVKAYTRARAAVNAFGRHAELLDARIQVVHRISPPLAAAGAYVVFLDRTVFSEDLSFTCKTWVWPVANLQFTVLDFNYDIPIYIASISVSLKVTGDFKAEVDLTVCAEPSAKVSFRPTIGVTVSGSGGVAIVLVRGAIGVSGSISYTLGPELRALVPSDGCKVCLSLNQGWTPVKVTVSAGVDGRWLPWGSWKHLKSWDLWSWYLGGREFSPIDGLNWCFDPKVIFDPRPKPTSSVSRLPASSATSTTTSSTSTSTSTSTVKTTSSTTTTLSTATSTSTSTVQTTTSTTTSTTTAAPTSTSTTTTTTTTTLTTTTIPAYTPTVTSTLASTTTSTSTTTTTTTTTTAPAYTPTSAPSYPKPEEPAPAPAYPKPEPAPAYPKPDNGYGGYKPDNG
ncbi:hypothetical protein HDU97_009396, partial [Phlyctochytrium planicorne]